MKYVKNFKNKVVTNLHIVEILNIGHSILHKLSECSHVYKLTLGLFQN